MVDSSGEYGLRFNYEHKKTLARRFPVRTHRVFSPGSKSAIATSTQTIISKYSITFKLRFAIAQVSRLSSDQQNLLASQLIDAVDEINDDAFDRTIALNPGVAIRLAEEALANHRAGLTEPLDPHSL